MSLNKLNIAYNVAKLVLLAFLLGCRLLLKNYMHDAKKQQ